MNKNNRWINMHYCCLRHQSNILIVLLSFGYASVNQNSKTISYIPDSQRTLSPFTNTCLLFSVLQLISPAARKGLCMQTFCYKFKILYNLIMSGFKQTQSANQTHFITIILYTKQLTLQILLRRPLESRSHNYDVILV